MSKEITLTRGRVAVVDDSDFDRLMQWRWYCANPWPGLFYASRATPRGADGKQRTIMMHREILGVSSDVLVDHINHDGLDNRRSNLRACSARQNSMNARGVRVPGHSKFKGVTREGPRWMARIYANGKRIYLGSFETDVAAARAYDEAAVQMFGEFACVNFPGGAS